MTPAPIREHDVHRHGAGRALALRLRGPGGRQGRQPSAPSSAESAAETARVVRSARMSPSAWIASTASRRTARRFYAVERDGELRRALRGGRHLRRLHDRASRCRGGLERRRRCWRRCGRRRSSASGLNYRDHAAEVKKPLPAEPLLFLKPSTAVLDPGAPIRLPPGVGRVDHEAELAVVIGRRAHRVPRAQRLGLHPRPHLPERRDGARPAEQGDRSTRAARASTRSRRSARASRPASNGAPRARRRLGQRRAPPGVDDRAADLPDRAPRRVHHVRHDARARRRHLDRHAVGHRRR